MEFASNGSTAAGYLARPESGTGPGVLVLQEWWGLVPQLKGVCDRLATEGFTALAPDLYHGDHAEHTEMDKAGALMNAMPPDRAARDMGGAVDFLRADAGTTGERVGVVGFCMGGLLTLIVAAQQGDKIGVAIPYYGAPLGEMAPDWSGLTAPVHGFFAGHDDFFPPEAIRALEQELKGMGKDVTFEVYADHGHAFANEDDPLGTFDPDAAARSWAATVDLLGNHLR